jgi:predicted CoA-binding protein
MVVIFRRPEAVVYCIRQAAAKRAAAVWLPPGAWSRDAEEAATKIRSVLPSPGTLKAESTRCSTKRR